MSNVIQILVFLAMSGAAVGLTTYFFICYKFTRFVIHMVPTRTGKTGNLEKWERIFQSGNFIKTGKVREFYPKYWKNQKKIILERSGNLSGSNSENPANMVLNFK